MEMEVRMQTEINKQTKMFQEKEKKRAEEERREKEAKQNAKIIKNSSRNKSVDREKKEEKNGTEKIIIVNNHLKKKKMVMTVKKEDGTKEEMESWKVWWLYPKEMEDYVSNKKLLGKFFARNEDDDEEIKCIVDFTDRHRLKTKTTYTVVWDTGNIQHGVSHKCLTSDANSLLQDFWKKQQKKIA